LSRPANIRLHTVWLLCLAPMVSQAHSFGIPYVLPIPLWMYAYGCATTVVLTFVVLGVTDSARVSHPSIRAIDLGGHPQLRMAVSCGIGLLRAGAVLSLLVTIASGLIGTDDPARNIGMTLFWVIFLLGFAYITLLAGDLFQIINPWKLMIEGLESLGLNLSRERLNYPSALGYWPALAFYVALIWMELFTASKPSALSIVLLAYTGLTLAGVAAFGKDMWFGRADIFSIYFRLIGILAPVRYAPLARPFPSRVEIRPLFAGVLSHSPAHISLVLVVLFMLSSTTYDAIHDTALWTGLFWRNALWLLQSRWNGDLGRAQSDLMAWYLAYRQVGLIVLPLLYLAVYLGILLWAKALTRSELPLLTLCFGFCYALLPIAVAYHIAHYLSFLVIEIKTLPSLLADPFGLGWKLLSIQPAEQQPKLSMGVIWHAQVAAILVGHIVSTYLAHTISVRIFPSRRRAIFSQIPILLLMVAYTIFGIWVLALPLGTLG
jgi:hypothetical protein